MNSSSDTPPASKGWDTYWHGAGHSAAFSGGGTSHPLVISFWDEFFRKTNEDYGYPNIVDIASGSGAVIDCAREAFDGAQAIFTCVDISRSAIASLIERYPSAIGVVADARAIPLESGSYDIVTSQFGIEYAGLDAINEVARLPVSGGRVALLLHHRHGGIYRQCSASLDAIRMLQASQFIPRTIETFEAGFAAYRGETNSNVPDAAVKMNSAIKAVESIMLKHGRDVADGTIIRLYKDVATIHSRLSKYEKSEVLGWLEGMQQELVAYAERMASMCAAAVDTASFEGLKDTLKRCGYRIDRADSLQNASTGIPLGWILIATRA